MKMRPETAKSILAQKISAGQLVDEKTANLLNEIKDGARVIELGGIGIVAEYLATTKNCSVRLCEETRLYFVFRRNLLPKSPVIEINMDPRLLNYSKPYYDAVIINGPQYLDAARKLTSSIIFDTELLTIEKVNNAADNIAVDKPVTKNVVSETTVIVHPDTYNDILNWDIQEGT